MDAALEQMVVRLSDPVHTARGTVADRPGVVVVLSDHAGRTARGEIAPLPGWSSCSFAAARAQAERWIAETLATGEPAVCDVLAPEARAGIDAALWGLTAAEAQVPLWRALGGRGSGGSIDVNALVTAADPGELASAASRAQADGFSTLKTKLGMGDDHARLRALAGATDSGTRIRLDANASWDVSEATAMTERATSVLGERLEYIEDPVGSLDELEQLRSVNDSPVAVDELVRGPADLDRVIGAGLADVVVLKPAFLGGCTDVLDLARLARAAAVDVVISAAYDGAVGLEAWCHLA
ncbi:MAG: o-succinylbenzoate synthase, partial [Acidimicrobiales bacterium]